MVDDVEGLRRGSRRFDEPLCACPQTSDDVVDMDRVGSQILFPQPLHLFAQGLVDTSHAQRGGQKLARVRAVDVRHAEHEQIQAFDLGQVFLGLQLPLCELRPGLRLVGFFARDGVGLVDHASAALDEAPYLAAGSLLAHGHGEAVRPQFVDLVLLREARLAAAVEDKVKLVAIGAVEYAGKRLCVWSASGSRPTQSHRGIIAVLETYVLSRHRPARSAPWCRRL